MTFGLTLAVLLVLLGGLAFAAIALRRAALGALRNALTLFALNKGLTQEDGSEAYIGRVKELPLRVGIERDPSGRRRLALSLRGRNPKRISFVLRRSGIRRESNFHRAAPELVVALQRLKPGFFDELEVIATGEMIWRHELRLPVGLNAAWLSERLAECQEIAKQLPKRRAIRSVSGALETPGDDEASSSDVCPPETEKTDVDKTEPHADGKLA